jgi:hypothetical protein
MNELKLASSEKKAKQAVLQNGLNSNGLTG